MRIPVGRQLRVWSGDIVTVKATLGDGGRNGRLQVFAAEPGNSLSPYVPGLASGDRVVFGNRPEMMTPLLIQLNHGIVPSRDLSFTVDFNGVIQIMQDIDRHNDPLVKVRVSRKGPWRQKLENWLWR